MAGFKGMMVRDHGSHVNIEGDEEILKLAGFYHEPTKQNPEDTRYTYKELYWFFDRAWKTRKRDHAAIYSVARSCYIGRTNTERGYYK
ncbi:MULTISPECIES: hypothetical protein [Bacillus cereus group]|nr:MULTISPECIES: hypothetical protein [Bacillus cereus group]